MNRAIKIITSLLVLLVFNNAKAQQYPPFYNEIQQFKKQDSTNFPPKNAILFVGSSSFQNGMMYNLILLMQLLSIVALAAPSLPMLFIMPIM